MTLSDLRVALLTVTTNVKHFDGKNMTGNYIIWAEEGQGDSVWADGKMKEQVIAGTIDYFTKTEDDPNFDAIQAALSLAGISFKINSIKYEDDTKYIHYEWVFNIG